jgi:DNA polymerase II large subunit
MSEHSEEMGAYFKSMSEEVEKAFALAQEARKKGYDPVDHVEVALAANLAERVIGLISVLTPQIKGTGVVDRIIALEEEYGKLDWRVAFVIALEVAQEKFCTFTDKIEAIETGIRVGFAYVTVGVVSAPLEGFTKLELKPRADGKGDYFSLWYSGPIRNAGGTAAAVSVLIADYVRKHLGYAPYDPTEQEIHRCYGELEDYHTWITNLQYFPSQEESEFLMQHLPVEINGDESEKYEVSNVNLKDLPRVRQNRLRNGYCLIHSSCIPLKSPKLWKRLSEWGHDFGLEQWDFLGDFVKLQKKMKAKGKKEVSEKLAPDYTYIQDLVAGRPVYSHPLKPGGWRLRYGRSRASGYSGQAIHPASMQVLQDFLATGTQLKVERPGKAAAFTPCDTIDGPIVLLRNGSVKRLNTEAAAKKVKHEIKEILYLGDVLINYGDFFDRAHTLVPAGYCPEFWIGELEKAATAEGVMLDEERLAAQCRIGAPKLSLLLKKPLTTIPSFEEARKISLALNIPLHPTHTLFWSLLTIDELTLLCTAVSAGKEAEGKLILKNDDAVKRILETLGVEHLLVEKESLVLEKEAAFQLSYPLGDLTQPLPAAESSLELINHLSPVTIRDKGGVFIGSRMGRPEKAKMRKMTGSPHCLFPIGEEGGRLRSFQSALEKKKVTASFPICKCNDCNIETPLFRCPKCDKRTEQYYHSSTHGLVKESIPESVSSTHRSIDFHTTFYGALKKLGTNIYPDLIKGVRGTMNKEHIPEHPAKGILRAKHNVHVNKDGTIRYDASEVTLTHFKPKEVSVSPERLVELGYTTDIHGEPLMNEEQILELKAQDVVLPCCPENPEEPADTVFFNTANFIDELLVKLYSKKPYFNLQSKQDLVGQLIIGLAPHTSAGILGRIIGFSKTQGFLAHPYFHAAMRRDCFSYGTYIPIKHRGIWQLRQIGELVEELSPSKIVDAHGTREITPKGYHTLGLKKGKIVPVPITAFTQHTPMPHIEFTTHLGKHLKSTANHKHVVVRDGKECVVRAEELARGDVVKLPYAYALPSTEIKEIDLLKELADEEWVMIRGLKAQLPQLYSQLRKQGVSDKDASNFSTRDSVPLRYAKKLLTASIAREKLSLAAKYDTIELPLTIPLSESFLKLVGLYVAEGYAQQQRGVKGSYQVYIAAQKKEIRDFVRDYFSGLGLKPSERKTDRVTFSSRILYHLFTQTLKAGSSAETKRIPARLLSLPLKKIGYILSGYFEGDGSVSTTDLRLVFDTVSTGLLRDIEFILGRMGVFLKERKSTSQPGPVVRKFYEKKNLPIPFFTSTRGIIQSKFVTRVSQYVSFISKEKRERHEHILKHKKFRNLFCDYDEEFFYDKIITVNEASPEESYCLTVENHHVIANGILTKQCDGDEGCFLLLMDAFLNFSRKYLPETRGSTMDAPLVLTSVLTPSEVDDMAFHVDIPWKYPLEFYEATMEYKKPWEVSIPQIKDVLETAAQYEGMGFTHDTSDINAGVRCSAYKLLPSMEEKMKGQMSLAVKIRACDASDVARLVIEKHFIRDTKGNLRKFSQQEFRCVSCNEKFRRPPLRGSCTSCSGKVIFTISEGSVVKYLEPSISLATKYNVPTYLQQDLEMTKRRIESVFGKDAERQEGLGQWFSEKE